MMPGLAYVCLEGASVKGARNKTDKGRAENRRVELRALK
jgi:flagellar motor protein MotB